MKLSTKGRYAVMAMADIASQPPAMPVSLAAIAERQHISQEYLEQLFAKLRRRGIVESARGPGGGYRLARDPEDIRISDIVIAVDEPLQVTRCAGDAIDGCVDGHKCITHDLWSALGRQIYSFLSAVTLGDVIHKRNFALQVAVRRAKAHPVRAAV
ncbi:MAG TPA: Rrf2 family transcriptional regulator [Aestuariivirgaceae bacterium]|nr:Rrf2 family transcriptional regulator [Aestuariivirgaceae bacterium]